MHMHEEKLVITYETILNILLHSHTIFETHLDGR